VAVAVAVVGRPGSGSENRPRVSPNKPAAYADVCVFRVRRICVYLSTSYMYRHSVLCVIYTGTRYSVLYIYRHSVLCVIYTRRAPTHRDRVGCVSIGTLCYNIYTRRTPMHRDTRTVQCELYIYPIAFEPAPPKLVLSPQVSVKFKHLGNGLASFYHGDHGCPCRRFRREHNRLHSWPVHRGFGRAIRLQTGV